MGRGKNYVNQNKGMTLASMKDGSTSSTSNHTSKTSQTTVPQLKNSSKQKKSMVMEMCFYGRGCTRKGCIYKHPTKVTTKTPATPSATTTSNNHCTVNGKKNEYHSNEDDTAGVVVVTPPCKPYLLNMCSFNAGTCLKRHVKRP